MNPIRKQSNQYLQNQNSLPNSIDRAYYLSLPVIPATVTDLIDSDDSVEIPLDISQLSQDQAVSNHIFTELNPFTRASFTPPTSIYTTDLSQRDISEIDIKTTGYPGNSNINTRMATRPLRRKKVNN